jgi:hypothetical protein
MNRSDSSARDTKSAGRVRGSGAATTRCMTRHREGLGTPPLPASVAHPGLLMTVEQVAATSVKEVGHAEPASDHSVGRADLLLHTEKC